jgi:hypothetical protein
MIVTADLESGDFAGDKRGATNQYHDSVRIAHGQLRQTISRTLKDWFMGVFKGPKDGISDGPILVGIYMKEMEVGRWRGEEARREDKRSGDCG